MKLACAGCKYGDGVAVGGIVMRHSYAEECKLDGPECPPGVHSIFDPCPGGCTAGPCGCPCDACTHYCEQLDCE